MSVLAPRSLQLRLALRLGLLFLAATALTLAALLYQTYRAADSLGERNLIERAHDLARLIRRDDGGDPMIDLPPELAAAYGAPSGPSAFAIRDAGGRVIAASGDEIAALAARRSPANDEPAFFRLDSFGAMEREYYGLDLRLDSAAGPVSITVAEANEAEALIHAMLREFIFDAAWTVPVFLAATLLVGVFAIRGGLKPLREASRQAAMIEPGAISQRLSTLNLPGEIAPLVAAVNKALDRLEQGFALQRQFTANAAHELRTPLTVISGALETIEGPLCYSDEIAKLRQDAGRMNRLVDQLLRVARLDAAPLNVGGEVDLNVAAAEVVEYMAPLAIAQERSIAYNSADRPVMVKGARHAIEDAIRNLIENAVHHAPPRSEVLVEVSGEGAVSVCDRGPGVRREDRERIFDRFWRGKEAPDAGAGLGLAIVLETMKAHGGAVEIADNPGGGARFTLRFRRSAPNGDQ